MSTPINESDYVDATESYQGWCRSCKAFTHDSAEPDARNYECPECGKREVFGAEEALLMGLITFN